MGKKHFHFIYNNSYLQDDHIVNVLHPFFKYLFYCQAKWVEILSQESFFFDSSVSLFYITLESMKVHI